jgi:hypothetical protein
LTMRSCLRNSMDKNDTRNLRKRYLIWLYKTTKEELDRIERKFTQLEVDKFILKELRKQNKEEKLKEFITEFENYINNKEKEGLAQKFDGGKLSAGFIFLEAKLKSIEKAIVKELGASGLHEVKSLYEKEMTERILKSSEHK